MLRGFALFGIIQINLPAFLTGMDPINALVSVYGRAIDQAVFVFNTFFIEAKFYPLFAFLFGYGFRLQWEGLRRRGINPEPFLMRRYLFLLVLGVGHGSLLFFGDILTMYALSGMVLLWTTPADGRGIRRRVGIWFVATLAILGLQFFAPSPIAPDESLEALRLRLEASMLALAKGPYAIAAIGRAQLFAMAQIYQFVTFLVVLVFYMSIGALAARVGVLRRPDRFARLWRRCIWIGIGLGVPVNLIFAWCQWRLAQDPNDSVVISLGSEVSNQFAVLMTPAYVALAVYAGQRAQHSRVLRFTMQTLGQMGRLALTNYLTQSVLMVLLFSNLGLGMANRLSIAALALIGFAVCLLQAAFARLYLRVFQMGPIEALWRRFVYAADLG